MGAPRLSVVIPTHNRKEILGRCLTALANQTIPPEEFEVIVVDDGSADGSAEAAREGLRDRFPHWRVLEGPNRGPAHARNCGMMVASAPLILVLGDDMIGDAHLVAEHLSWHRDHPGDEVAVVGFVDWHPELPETPILRWFREKDKPFNYGRIRHGQEVDFWYFLSCNVSFKRAFVMGHPLFDTDFRFAAFEDIEYGYRLQKRGLRILHDRRAVTYHYHPMTLDGFCRRLERVGESTALFYEKVPELRPARDGNAATGLRLRDAAVLRAYESLGKVLPPDKNPLLWRYYKTRAHLAFLEGLRRGRSRSLPEE